MVDVRQSGNNERITFIKYLYDFKTYMDIYVCACVCVCIYEKIFWFHRGGKDKNNLYVQACKLSDVFRLLCCTVTSIIPLYIILIPALLHVILYFNISHDDNVKYKIDRERERKRNLFEK